MGGVESPCCEWGWGLALQITLNYHCPRALRVFTRVEPLGMEEGIQGRLPGGGNI
jgi:hypothetical protein